VGRGRRERKKIYEESKVKRSNLEKRKRAVTIL
jgi:hypothetical protein